MHKKNLDLIVVLLIGALNVGWALLHNPLPFIGILLALPLVFLLPGYALTEALFKRAPDDTKSLIVKPHARMGSSFPLSNRLIFSLGLSLVIDIITGLVLDTLPIGLRQSSWAVALVVLTTIFALIGAYLRRGGHEQQNGHLGHTLPGVRSISLYEYTLFALALVITVLSIWYDAFNAIQQQEQTSFTQFWMVPSRQDNDNCSVLIGIQSFGPSPVTYEVVLTANGLPLSKWSSIVLAPHEQWYQSVPITSSRFKTVTLNAQLYRTDQPQKLYRETHLAFVSSIQGNKSKLLC